MTSFVYFSKNLTLLFIVPFLLFTTFSDVWHIFLFCIFKTSMFVVLVPLPCYFYILTFSKASGSSCETQLPNTPENHENKFSLLLLPNSSSFQNGQNW